MRASNVSTHRFLQYVSDPVDTDELHATFVCALLHQRLVEILRRLVEDGLLSGGEQHRASGREATHSVTTNQGPQHCKQTQFHDSSAMDFQNSRIIISAYFKRGEQHRASEREATHSVTTHQGPQNFKQTKFPEFSVMDFQNSRIIISTYFQFETVCRVVYAPVLKIFKI